MSPARPSAIGIAGPFTLEPFLGEVECAGRGPGSLPPGLGGTSVVTLVKALLESGRRVVVFTLDPAVSREVVLQGPQLKICVGPFRARHRARDLFAAERAYLRAAFLREQPAVLHAHWTYEYALAALETAIPTLVTAHDAPFRGLWLLHDPYRAARAWMALLVARRARHMTAVSSHVARHFRRFLGYRGEIELVANAVPPAAFDLGERRRRPGDAAIVFATVLTGWSAIKNGPTALLAFARVRQSLPAATLQMFGNGYGEGEQAQAWARRHRCAAGVAFRGMLPYAQLLEQLAAGADILVHPAREEAFSMAVAEAMALGIPAIGGAQAGAIPELLQDGETGLLSDITSDRQLAAAMLRLARDRALRARLAAAARDWARRRFAPPAVAAAYQRIYDQLTALPRPVAVGA